MFLEGGEKRVDITSEALRIESLDNTQALDYRVPATCSSHAVASLAPLNPRLRVATFGSLSGSCSLLISFSANVLHLKTHSPWRPRHAEPRRHRYRNSSCDCVVAAQFIVQSVQAIFKKLLKIKSRQLELSLVDLFKHIVPSPEAEAAEPSLENKAATKIVKSPILQLLTRGKHASEIASKNALDLYQAVIAHFKEIGRLSEEGKAMLDSLSKDDLTKVLRSLAAPDTLLPNLVNQLKEATTVVNSLQDALDGIEIKYLEGEASAKFAAMRDVVEPVLSDLRSIMSGKQLKPALVLGDVMSLRQIKLDEVLKLLGEVQSKVEQDIKTEETKPTSIKLEGLRLRYQTGLQGIAKTIIEVRQKFDGALAPMRTKLTEVEVWYDTVMQSFNERYAPSMKTWAVVVSAVVVVFLNANFFTIYQNITTNGVVRNLIIETGLEVLARAKDAKASEWKANEENQSEKPNPSPSPSPSPTASSGSVTLTTITTTSPPTGVTTTTTTQDSEKQSTEELLSSFKENSGTNQGGRKYLRQLRFCTVDVQGRPYLVRNLGTTSKHGSSLLGLVRPSRARFQNTFGLDHHRNVVKCWRSILLYGTRITFWN